MPRARREVASYAGKRGPSPVNGYGRAGIECRADGPVLKYGPNTAYAEKGRKRPYHRSVRVTSKCGSWVMTRSCDSGGGEIWND